MDNQQKIVEIARFQFPADAYTLMALLESEGITCYLRNEKTATLLSHLDVGGARLEILESDVPKAMEVMKEGGYDIPGENDSLPKDAIDQGSFLNKIPFIKNLPFPVQIILFIVLIFIFLLVVLMMGGKGF